MVVVDESATLRNTVAYAVERAAAAGSPGDPASVHFVVAESSRIVDPEGSLELSQADDLLERVQVWVGEDLGDEAAAAIEVETAIVGADQYLFAPDDYADAILAYAESRAIDRIVLDPEYDPGTTAPMLQPLEARLRDTASIPVETAPVERPQRRTVLARTGTARKFAVVFAGSFLFYQALGTLNAFDLVTGLVVGVFVSVLLAPVSFGRQPSIRRLARQVARLGVYVPYLLWEIVVANLKVAYVVLHPSLPIDPAEVQFRAAVWGDTPVTTLANSITLTPGTLTVDVTDNGFTVHSLTQAARDDLFGGSLERAVRFVFYGRAAAGIPSPRERARRREEDDE